MLNNTVGMPRKGGTLLEVLNNFFLSRAWGGASTKPENPAAQSCPEKIEAPLPHP